MPIGSAAQMSNKLDSGSVSLRQYKRMKYRHEPSLRDIKAARDAVANESSCPVTLILKLTEGAKSPVRIKVRFLIKIVYCVYGV